MKKIIGILKKVPKWILVLCIIVFVIVLSAVLDNNSNYKKEYSDIDYEQKENNYIYKSNNYYNLDFKYDDIKKAELAEYDKYITSKAKEEILNQKIYVKIESFQPYVDESTATCKKYSAIAIDHNGNKWKTISYDYSSSVESENKNLKVYGIYRGIEIIDEEKIPIVEVYTYYMDADYIDKDNYKKISNKYISKLAEMYPKESFKFDSFDEWSASIRTVYKNKNNDIELSIEINENKESINLVNLHISNYQIDFSDVDRNFLYSIIKCFDGNITNDMAENMIVMAEANAVVNSTTEELERYGMPITFGTHNYRDNKITIYMYTKTMELEKNKSY